MIANIIPALSASWLVPAAEGFIVGAFTPAVGRKVKAAIVKAATYVVKEAEVEIKKAEAKLVSDGQAAIAAAEKV